MHMKCVSEIFFKKNINMYLTLRSQYFYHQIKRTDVFNNYLCTGVLLVSVSK